jgi:hypothetical protein
MVFLLYIYFFWCFCVSLLTISIFFARNLKITCNKLQRFFFSKKSPKKKGKKTLFATFNLTMCF